MKLYVDVRLATDADAIARRLSLTAELEPDGLDPLARLQRWVASPSLALAWLGGLRGGKARAARLTPERRSEIARDPAKARWFKLREIPLDKAAGSCL